jgi:hypothetical protein
MNNEPVEGTHLSIAYRVGHSVQRSGQWFAACDPGDMMAQSARYVGHCFDHYPQIMDECGAAGGMSGKGDRSAQRKPAPLPRCQP